MPPGFQRLHRCHQIGTEYTVSVRVPDGIEGLAAIYDKSLDVRPKAKIRNSVRLEPKAVSDVQMDIALRIYHEQVFR